MQKNETRTRYYQNLEFKLRKNRTQKRTLTYTKTYQLGAYQLGHVHCIFSIIF